MNVGKMYRYIDAPNGQSNGGVYRGGETVVVIEKVYVDRLFKKAYVKILLESGNIIDAFLREKEWEQV